MRNGRYPTTATRGKLLRALKELESFANSYRINNVTDREFARINNAISEIQEVEARMYRDEENPMGDRLEYLRGEIEAERISLTEIHELQVLGDAGLIPDHDVVLLEWAGVPEFGDERVSASRNA